MASHLYIEIQFICICFFAILLYRIMRLDDRRTSQIYLRLLLIASMLTFLFDAAQAALLDFDPTNHIGLVYLFNVLYYVFLGFMCYYWFLYSEAEQDSVLAASSPMRAKMAIPLMLLIVLTATTPWTHLLFYIDDQGEYVRGSLHWVQLIISYIYCFPTAIKAYVLSCKTTDYAAKSHLRTTSYLILPVVFTGIAQAFLPNLPILCAGCCDSVLFGYIALQEENISIDPLTKVNNRRRMLHHLETLISRAREEHMPFGLLMIDVDKFKGINDTYGHVEGDNALIHVASAIVKATSDDTGVQVFRYGGDEFIVTSEVGTESKLDALAKSIQASVVAEAEAMQVPYKLAVSVGYTVFDFTDASAADIVSRADAKLYDEKHSKKNNAA